MVSPVLLHRPGTLAYANALAWMRASHAALAAGEGAERLALLQHLPVYTVGARGGAKHLLVPIAELAARGAELAEVDRGGDITFHGPGQLVAYPILDLRRRQLRAADYVRALEQTVIEALASFEVPAQRIPVVLACGRRSALRAAPPRRSRRSACASGAASPRTGSRST